MSNLSVKQAKGGFLDRKAVIDAVSKAKIKVLGRQGALVRRIAKNSMKRRKGPAPAGSPPNAHEGKLKDFLFFAYDTASQTMVVGPAKLGKGTAPKIQEHGGIVYERGFYDRRGRWVPLRSLPVEMRAAVIQAGKITLRACKVEPRPFMKPGLEKAKPMLAKEWRGAVKK